MKHTNRLDTPYTRRSFLKASALATAALALPGRRVLGANGDIRVAVIGLGGKGRQHSELFGKVAGTRVVAVCDVDATRVARVVEEARKRGESPETANDPRRILERKDVDAVVIATPNHWHALLTLWAIQAGKDVYVEKPVSHSVWEGERMVAAQKSSGRVVQAGTQYRSCRGLGAATAWLNEGHVGKPLWGHVLWYQHRPPIGKCAPFTPTDVNYDLWCGPAPCEPLTRPKLHYDWHWVWATGDGDLGNSGIHAFDACRWFARQKGFPRRVLGLGGRFTYDDAAQTPNTQLTLLDYPDVPILIENRNLPMEKDMDIMDTYRRIREGFVVQYEGGYFAGLRAGGVVIGPKGERLKEFPGDGGNDHQVNFIEAVRNRRQSTLHAPIQEGHISSAVCHLGNLAYRLGQPTATATCRQTVAAHAHADETFDRLVKSLEGIGVDLGKTPFAMGPWLEINPKTGQIRSAGKGQNAKRDQARAMSRGAHRAPYVLPEKV
jgi:predicted dehydrogenase